MDMNGKLKVKELPNRSNHNCFGCGPGNPNGLRMKFFTDDNSVFSRISIPAHLCGWDNLVHGGVLSTILDEIMSWSAIYLLKKFILTKSITVDFLHPVYVKEEVQAVGRVLKMSDKREALMEGIIRNIDDKICARSQGTFALLDSRMIQKMGIISEKAVRDFQPIFEA